jgi:hypothetical protein
MTYQCSKCDSTRVEVNKEGKHCLVCGAVELDGYPARFPFKIKDLGTKVEENPKKGSPGETVISGQDVEPVNLGAKMRTAKGPGTGIADGGVRARPPLGKEMAQGDRINGESGVRQTAPLKEAAPCPAPDPENCAMYGATTSAQPAISIVRKNRTVQGSDMVSGPLCKCGCGRVVEPRKTKGGSPKVFASAKCRNEYHTKEWKKAHPERTAEIVRKSIKKYRANNREMVREKAKVYARRYYLKRKGKEGDIGTA